MSRASKYLGHASLNVFKKEHLIIKRAFQVYINPLCEVAVLSSQVENWFIAP